MANEATINSYLQIKKGNLDYSSRPTSFKATVTTEAGPSPGQVTVTQAGVNIDLTEITVPGGFCRIQNIDSVTSSTNYLEVGIWDGSSFYPLMELLQGESYVFRLARNLGEEFGVGTGTTGAGINTLRLKAFSASMSAVVEAFNK